MNREKKLNFGQFWGTSNRIRSAESKYLTGFTLVKFNKVGKSKAYLTGFTLVEILIVVAIIGILATIVSLNVINAQEKSKVTKTITQIDTIKKAVRLYYIDTYDWPPTCRSVDYPNNCNATKDPFMLAPSGVTRWNGPYIDGGIYAMAHPWGGAMEYWKDGTSGKINVDDDVPGSGSGNDNGQVPDSALLKIDQILDDGNLSTGLIVRGVNNNGPVPGSITYTFVTF